MLPEHANTAPRTKGVENQGMSVCSALINQRCALIRVFACFIRTLVCSKKKHHQVLKTNNLPSSNAFNRYILVIWFSEKGIITN